MLSRQSHLSIALARKHVLQIEGRLRFLLAC